MISFEYWAYTWITLGLNLIHIYLIYMTILYLMIHAIIILYCIDITCLLICYTIDHGYDVTHCIHIFSSEHELRLYLVLYLIPELFLINHHNSMKYIRWYLYYFNCKLHTWDSCFWFTRVLYTFLHVLLSFYFYSYLA